MRSNQFSLRELLVISTLCAIGFALLRIAGATIDAAATAILVTLIGACFGGGIGVLMKHPLVFAGVGAAVMAAVFVLPMIAPPMIAPPMIAAPKVAAPVVAAPVTDNKWLTSLVGSTFTVLLIWLTLCIHRYGERLRRLSDPAKVHIPRRSQRKSTFRPRLPPGSSSSRGGPRGEFP